ncbi:hypothetical protein ACFXNW_01255 [Nocardia sp. NPDC059180]|uniref:hypothetical protein n=1 Tax=Nocardia sp. NPDC059180 TaxID=3346761 RepID=UPI0036AD38AD
MSDPNSDPSKEPWIKLSHCGVGRFDDATNTLIAVACPSRFCLTWVPLIGGKLGSHEGLRPGVCCWSGIRVVDDRADHPGRPRDRYETGTVWEVCP